MCTFFSLLRMVARKTMINGFTSSIGWNLGKKNMLSQRLAPLTSEPIIGTKNKKNKEIKNKKIESLKRFFLFKDEKKIRTVIPINIYAKCLKKKK